MIVLLNILILIASFYLLAVICDRYFINSLDTISHKLKMSSDMAGATFMAIGTSAPEMAVSLMALFKPGNEVMGAGTIVGSAIFNILVIVGASALVRKACITWQPIIRDILFYSLSIILLLFAFKDGTISFKEAGIFILFYGLYVIAVIYWKKIFPYKDEIKDTVEHIETFVAKEKTKETRYIKIMIFVEKCLDFVFPTPKHYWRVFSLSILMITGLSWVLVESAVVLATVLHIPAVIIGLTVLAVGTSIPDLISSIIVAKQGRGGMAISNAVGSNIFDILLGLGLPWLIVLGLTGQPIIVKNEDLTTSVLILFTGVIAILFILIIKKWKLGKFSGYSLIGLYIAYLIWAIYQAVS